MLPPNGCARPIPDGSHGAEWHIPPAHPRAMPTPLRYRPKRCSCGDKSLFHQRGKSWEMSRQRFLWKYLVVGSRPSPPTPPVGRFACPVRRSCLSLVDLGRTARRTQSPRGCRCLAA